MSQAWDCCTTKICIGLTITNIIIGIIIRITIRINYHRRLWVQSKYTPSTKAKVANLPVTSLLASPSTLST